MNLRSGPNASSPKRSFAPPAAFEPGSDLSARVLLAEDNPVNQRLVLRILEKAGHSLASETDTECVAHLIEEAYEGDLADAVRKAVAQLTGAYALVVTSTDEPDVIVGVKVSSPLVVGLGSGENMLASDIPALLDRTRTFVPISEGQVVEVRAGSVRVTDLEGRRTYTGGQPAAAAAP